MDKKLTSAVYAAVEKAYDHQCDIEDAADEILEIIEADRKRRGEPVSDSQRVYLRDYGKHEYLDGAACQYAIERGKPFPYGDPVAYVYEKEDAERIVAALNNEPVRGEPVKVLMEALRAAAEYIGDRSAGSSRFWDLYDAALAKVGEA